MRPRAQVEAAARRGAALALLMLVAGLLSACAGVPLSGRGAASETGKIEIQRVVSPGGIEAWLVSEPAIPIIAVEAGFDGGAASDPKGQAGLAALTTALLTEGAGPYDGEAFRQRLQELNMSLSASVGRDATLVSMRTLSENRDDAFEMLRLAVTEPRFDADAVARVRDQLVIGLRRSEQSPRFLAGRELWRTMFPDHPYGGPTNGDPDSVAALTRADIARRWRDGLARGALKIAVVGDIDAETLAPLLDRTFGPLPASSGLARPPEVQASADGQILIERFDAPQSAILFAAPGLKRDDPDFIPAFVMMEIWGGGGLTSRLVQEVRGVRGLAYSVSATPLPLERSALIYGAAGTQNARAGETVGVIRDEIGKLSRGGVTAQELNDVKTYLTGSYPLRFDTNSKIASQLAGLQLQGYDIDYVNRRNSLIEAVTLDDIQRVAERLMREEAFTFVLVGQPEGVAAGPMR